MSALGWVFGPLAVSCGVALLVGRWLRLNGPADDDVWGCDECAAEQAELQRLAMLRHPSMRNRCPDYVPEEWAS